MRKLILFDFDGTLADTIPQITKILVAKAKEAGLGSISKTQMREFRSLSTKEIVNSFDIGKLRQLLLMVKCQRELGKEIEKANLADAYLPKILAGLRAQGNVLGIITTNSRKNVERFFKVHNLPEFDVMLCRAGILGKRFAILRAMEKVKVNPSATVYVTDEVHDILAAKRAGVKSVAVTWGFNTEAALRKASPTKVVSSARQLLAALSQ